MFRLLRHFSNTRDQVTQPTTFHITQYKCGSQWVSGVLKDSVGSRYVTPSENTGHIRNDELINGQLYPTVYLSKNDFDSILEKNGHLKEVKPFVVTRDMRDVMVSFYFSLKKSHAGGFTSVNRYRPILEELDTENGLLYLIDKHIGQFIKMQISWLDSSYPIFRYEDLLEHEYTIFKNIFEYCEISISQEKFNKIIDKHSFSTVSGRTRGNEDESHHLRKGIVGDWQNYFTPAVKEKFKHKFGNELILSGYENNHDW